MPVNEYGQIMVSQWKVMPPGELPTDLEGRYAR